MIFIVFVIVLSIGFIVLALDEDIIIKIVVLVFLLMISILSLVFGNRVGILNERDNIKQELVNSKKAKWRVNNQGDSYIQLTDSSLVGVWNYLNGKEE